MSPLVLELQGNPGDTVTGSFFVTNHSSLATNIDLKVENFYYDENDQMQLIKPEDFSKIELKQFALSQWIEIPDVLSISKDSRQPVNFSIKIPEDASLGGKYGVIFVNQGGDLNDEVSGFGIQGNVGILVLLTLPGGKDLPGELVEKLVSGKLVGLNDFDKKFFFFGKKLLVNGPVDFRFKFKNNSLTHYVPKGVVTVKNFFGKTLDVIAVDEKRIFPGGSRNLYARWDRQFLFGIYKAKLDVQDNLHNHFYSTRYFVGAPILLILLIVTLGASWYFYNKYQLKRMRKKILAEKEEDSSIENE
jgi:hypothetical protein